MKFKLWPALLTLCCSVSIGQPLESVLSWGEYGGRFISESGKIDRDLTLLQMKQRAKKHPWFMVGGDAVLITRYPKLESKPLYLFDQMSAELQNLRANAFVNFRDVGFFQMNYQLNSDVILDCFFTLGNLDVSPFFITFGKQYIPYGDFNKYEAEVNPLNKSIFRIDETAVTASWYKNNYLLRFSYINSREFFDEAFAISAQHSQKVHGVLLRYSGGIVSSINRMTKPLRTLSKEGARIPAANLYLIASKPPYSLRLELSQVLKPLTYANKLGAYNIDAHYRTSIWNKPFKLSASISGLYNKNNIAQDSAFERLGLFTQQWVLSIKHPLNRHASIGFSALLGKQRTYQTNAVFDVVIKY